jgi:hypothetical protein
MKFKFWTIVAMCLAFATCGATIAFAAPPTNPCSLLTTAQVSATMGITVNAGKQEGQFDCEWEEPGATLARGQRVYLHLLGPVGSLTPAQRFDTIKMPLPVRGITKMSLTGVGDDAVYVVRGNSPPELTVKKGAAVFQVRIQGLPRIDTSLIEAKEKALALHVLPNL